MNKNRILGEGKRGVLETVCETLKKEFYCNKWKFWGDFKEKRLVNFTCQIYFCFLFKLYLEVKRNGFLCYHLCFWAFEAFLYLCFISLCITFLQFNSKNHLENFKSSLAKPRGNGIDMHLVKKIALRATVRRQVVITRKISS